MLTASSMARMDGQLLRSHKHALYRLHQIASSSADCATHSLSVQTCQYAGR